MTPRWSADSWDVASPSPQLLPPTLDRALDRSGWMMLPVQAASLRYQNVAIQDLALITVPKLKMLVSSVQVSDIYLKSS